MLYRFYAVREETIRIELTFVVKPEKDLLDKILRKLGGKYDIKVFEKLPLLHQKRNYI